MTPAEVYRPNDVHLELAGTGPLGPIPHPFQADPLATQTIVALGGQPLLRTGDAFEHKGVSHSKPRAGSSFANPGGVTMKGRFTGAGQGLLIIDGVAAMTMAGTLETCSDAVPETTCDAAVLLPEVPVLFLAGRPVLPGCA